MRGPFGSLWPGSDFASRVKERFGAPVCSRLLRFLHLLRKGTSVPMTITSAPNAIKSHKDPRRAVGVGVVATAAGVLAVSEDALAVAAGVVAAAAGVAGSFRGCAGSRVG